MAAKERAIHLDYFDPAVGKVPNPGMGVQGYGKQRGAEHAPKYVYSPHHPCKECYCQTDGNAE